MKKLLTACLIFLFSSFLLLGHEFWLHPEKFIYKWGEIVNIKFLVGENFEGENWSGSKQNVQSLHLHMHGATDDLTTHLGDGKGDSLQFNIYEEGTYMVTFNSANRYIELKPDSFLLYLQEDGLLNAIEYRKEYQEIDSMGREFYQRSVKTIFQVGSVNSAIFNKQTLLPIDIIPQSNPYSLKNGDSITLKVLFQQKILTGALIKVWKRHNNKTEKTECLTNEKGECRVAVTTEGRWMISTVKMIRLQDDPKAQWQSYWGSCTWGYE